jgi:hypothetical protein
LESADYYTKSAILCAPFFLTIIGEPTHHSKIVAFQTPASPIM